MRKILLFYFLLLNACLLLGQDTTFDPDYFYNKRIEIALQHEVNNAFETHYNFKPLKTVDESFVLRQPSAFKSPYNVSQLKFKNKKIPEMIDYNNQMQCGPLQLRNSQDMMINTIKNYLINKYVFGLFVRTSYD